RKFSVFSPSAKRPRSSRTVVCSTTRLTPTLIVDCWPDWPGGGGCLLGTGMLGGGGSWAMRAPAKTREARTKKKQVPRCAFRAQERTKFSARNDNVLTFVFGGKELVAGGVVAGLGVDVERREAARGAEFDLDFAPAGIMNFVTRP